MLRWEITSPWYPSGESYTQDYVGPISDPLDASVEIPLCDSRTGSVTARLEEPTIQRLLFDWGGPSATTYVWLLRAWHRDQCVLWGPLSFSEANLAAGTVRLSAIDPSIRLVHHFLRRGDLTNGVQPLRKANEDRGIVTIDHRGLRALRDAGDNTPEQASYPPLGIADGDNDVDEDNTRLMSVTRGDQVWNAMLELSGSLGPDFELEPVTDTPGVYAQLNTYQRQGEDRTGTVKLHYGAGLDNLDGLKITEGERYITHAHVLDRENRYRFTEASTSAAADTGPYVHWDATDFDSSGIPSSKVENVLRAYGSNLLDAYGHPLVRVEATMKPETDDGIVYGRDYTVGDLLEVAGRAGGFQSYDLWARVTKVALNQADPDGGVRADLDLALDWGNSDYGDEQ